jgi:hypothetical protein
MSADAVNKAPELSQEEQKVQSDKEINFARVRKQLEEERIARQVAEQKAAEYERLIQQKKQHQEDEDDDPSDEPYVDHKRLERKFSRFERNLEQKMEKKAEEKAMRIFEEHKKSEWMRNNPDFYDVMANAQKFADKDPELAETILSMPDTFERQKLVYKNIKALGMHLKEQPKSNIQDTVDQNRRHTYYQPSGVATAPYSSQGDFSKTGQESSYKKMKELQSRLRLG